MIKHYAESLYHIKLNLDYYYSFTWASCLTSLTSLPSSAMSLSRWVQNLSMLASLSVRDLSIAFLTPVILGFNVCKTTTNTINYHKPMKFGILWISYYLAWIWFTFYLKDFIFNYTDACLQWTWSGTGISTSKGTKNTSANVILW